MSKYVVVSYDISEDKRRTKIHSVLKSYGQWVQYSIFECNLTDTQYAKLRSALLSRGEQEGERRSASLSRLAKVIKAEDSVKFYNYID